MRATSGALAALPGVGPAGAAGIAALGNFATQRISGTQLLDVNFTGVTLAAAGGAVSKWATGALVSAVGAENRWRPLAQLTVGESMLGVTGTAAVVGSRILPFRLSDMPVPALDTAAAAACGLPFPPPGCGGSRERQAFESGYQGLPQTSEPPQSIGEILGGHTRPPKK